MRRMRGRKERGSEEDDGKEGGREVVRKWMERNANNNTMNSRLLLFVREPGVTYK